MRGDLILHDLTNFFQGYGLIPRGNHTGTDRFAEDRVGGCDDANLLNFGMVNQHAFEFMGINFIAAAIDQVLGAAINFEVAIFFPGCQIPHVQPSIDNLFAGF